MLVKEVMSKKFITVKPSLNLIELIKLFRTYHFHRLPVTDEANHILGTVSIESVMGIFKPHCKRLTRMLRASPSLKVEEEEMDILDAEITPERVKMTSVSDLMESNFISIEEDKKGKALDGSFSGEFPSGNGTQGTDFVSWFHVIAPE